VARIVIIQGHPDADPGRFCRALAKAYGNGAGAKGHEVHVIDIATLDFPVLRSRQTWESDTPPPPGIDAAQAAIQAAEHLVFIFPLWLGTLPALLKAFCEQVFRPGFAFAAKGSALRARLGGRSSHTIVTMGMPAWVYRLWFGGHGLRSFQQGILRFVGIRPNRLTLIGSIEATTEAQRARWLARVKTLGERAR